MTQSRLLFNGTYLRIKQTANWEYAERTNASAAVIILAITPDDKLLLVEQFRIPIQARSIELPAGLVGDLGDDESLETATIRELIEETGWQPRHVEHIMTGPSSSGMSNEQVAFMRAQDLVRVGPGGGDASEDITVHEIPLQQAAAWLDARRREGFSIDPKLYAGLYFLDHHPDGRAVTR